MFSQTTINSFFKKELLPVQSNLFRKLLYAFIIVKCIYWLCYFGLLFGENNIIYSRASGMGGFKDLAFFLYHNSSPALSLICLIIVMSLSAGNLITSKLK